MKLRRILLVIFVSSFLLMLPLFSPSEQITVFPFTQSDILINIKSPRLQITTEIISNIELSIWYLDPVNEQIISIANLTIFQEATIDIDKRGNYIFSFVSIIFGFIDLNQQGIDPISPVIIGLIGLINLAFRYIENVRNIVDY